MVGLWVSKRLPSDITCDIANNMIVVDANVLVSALRSQNNASHLILRGMLDGSILFAVSTAVVLEYDDVLKRPGMLGANPWATVAEIDNLLNSICQMGAPSQPWFRFRPFLTDPKDDLYVECSLAANATLIVSHDKHFRNPDLAAFGINVMKSSEYVEAMKSERKP